MQTQRTQDEPSGRTRNDPQDRQLCRPLCPAIILDRAPSRYSVATLWIGDYDATHNGKAACHPRGSVAGPQPSGALRVSLRGPVVMPRLVLERPLQVLVALFFPVIVAAGAVRAVTSSLFLWIEYHRPGFPADSYGFSTEERMVYGSYTLNYVLNFAPAEYLGGLVNAEGDKLFLAREVGHMTDVKGVLSASFLIGLIMFMVSIAACVYLARCSKGAVRSALFSGAVLTLVLIVALTISAILGWEAFFTQVHALFFAAGTWTFRLDDTLIRLFPEQFWTDAAISVAGIVLLVTTLTVALGWPVASRRQGETEGRPVAHTK